MSVSEAIILDRSMGKPTIAVNHAQKSETQQLDDEKKDENDDNESKEVKHMGSMTKHAKEMHEKMANHDENDKWQSTNEIDNELKNNGGFSDPLGGDGYNTFEE